MNQFVKTTALALAAGMALSAAVPASAASAFGEHTAQAGWNHSRNRDNGAYHNSSDHRRYRETRDYDGPVWQGRDGRYRCRRSDGTTGLLIGGVVGGVIGHEIVGRRGDRTAGTLLGIAGGALVGRAIDRSGSRCR